MSRLLSPWFFYRRPNYPSSGDAQVPIAVELPGKEGGAAGQNRAHGFFRRVGIWLCYKVDPDTFGGHADGTRDAVWLTGVAALGQKCRANLLQRFDVNGVLRACLLYTSRCV